MIATRVSTLNHCRYCSSIYGPIARAHLSPEAPLVAQVAEDPENAPVSEKLKALLRIAERVQESGRRVTADDVAAARAQPQSEGLRFVSGSLDYSPAALRGMAPCEEGEHPVAG